MTIIREKVLSGGHVRGVPLVGEVQCRRRKRLDAIQQALHIGPAVLRPCARTTRAVLLHPGGRDGSA